MTRKALDLHTAMECLKSRLAVAAADDSRTTAVFTLTSCDKDFNIE
jgi:hypothetical protein